MTTPAMFDAPKPPALTLSAHFAKYIDRSAKYTDYKVMKRVQCEECVWIVHEAKGAGGAAICTGRVKRTSGLGVETILCAGHAERWKTRDGYVSPAGRRRR